MAALAKTVAGRVKWRSRFYQSAPVAQLDRVSGYEPEGRMFESCRAHHLKILIGTRFGGPKAQCAPSKRAANRIVAHAWISARAEFDTTGLLPNNVVENG